jgi:hypothetical protein
MTVDEKSFLVVYPSISETKITYHLAWVVLVQSGQFARKMKYFVDAQDGKILFVADMIRNGGEITTQVNRLYWPLHHYDTPVTAAGFPNVAVSIYNTYGQRVSYGYTDGNGSWVSSYLAYAAYYAQFIKNLNELASSYVAITNGDTKVDNSSYVTPPSSITRNWMTDETNVFHHVNVIHDFFVGAPYYYSTMNYQMTAKVHDGNYNGWSNGTNIGFGTEDGQVWAGAADVIYHEYTHCVIHHIYNNAWISFDRVGQDAAMDEGFADYHACAKTSDEIFGESVNVNRDLGNPLTMDNFDYNNPWYSGQIIAGVCWNLRQVLSSTDNLVFDALFRHSNNFSDFANDLVAEDDNDGNPNNGTPNLEIIRSKFYGKKIYFTAGPPGAPQNAIASGSVGQHPTISWAANSEPDLAGYKLYRKVTPDEQQFSLIATLGTSQTSYTDAGVTIRSGGTGGQWAQYYVKAYDLANNLSDPSNTVSKAVNYNPQKGYDDGQKWPDEPALPRDFVLEQNFPNPFNPETEIAFAVPEPADVMITVSDIMGREILTLTDGWVSAGYHKVRWTGVNASGQKAGSGIYFCRLMAVGESGKQFSGVKRMTILK